MSDNEQEIVEQIHSEMSSLWSKATRVRNSLSQPRIAKEIKELQIQSQHLSELLDQYEILRLETLPNETIVLARAAIDATEMICGGYKRLQRLT